MKDNLVIIHGGGPTAVLNCSLYGAIREAQQSGAVEHVYGAVGGTGGLLRENLLDFDTVPEEELERLPRTPPPPSAPPGTPWRQRTTPAWRTSWRRSTSAMCS